MKQTHWVSINYFQTPLDVCLDTSLDLVIEEIRPVDSEIDILPLISTRSEADIYKLAISAYYDEFPSRKKSCPIGSNPYEHGF